MGGTGTRHELWKQFPPRVYDSSESHYSPGSRLYPLEKSSPRLPEDDQRPEDDRRLIIPAGMILTDVERDRP